MLLSLLVIIAFAPGLFSSGATGILVKGLPSEFGTAVAHVDRFGIATLLNDRRQPIELGHFSGAAKSLPIGAEGHQQPRSQRRAGTGETAENRRLGVLIHARLNFFIERTDRSMQSCEHAGQADDLQA